MVEAERLSADNQPVTRAVIKQTPPFCRQVKKKLPDFQRCLVSVLSEYCCHLNPGKTSCIYLSVWQHCLHFTLQSRLPGVVDRLSYFFKRRSILNTCVIFYLVLYFLRVFFRRHFINLYVIKTVMDSESCKERLHAI